jgi:hypothetical protein
MAALPRRSHAWSVKAEKVITLYSLARGGHWLTDFSESFHVFIAVSIRQGSTIRGIFPHAALHS